MVGGTVSQVAESKNRAFAAGDFVLGYDGWQEYGLSDEAGLRKLDPGQAPLSFALGVLGMPGLTAYAALLRIGDPQPGETVVVSAAAGAVDSLVGQIAKLKECRVVGLSGSDDKCRFVVDTLGFDECINYKTADLAAALRAACPEGIDIYYDNVAGRILEIVLGQINLHGRIPLVGLISQYNATTPPPGPNLMPLLVKRAKIEGFLVGDHQDLAPTFQTEMTEWIKSGHIHPQEDIVDGLVNAPEAFLGLFSGRNLGKLIVRVSPDPSGTRKDTFAV
jgi:NADPH-dependent curcumin reductase CurA